MLDGMVNMIDRENFNPFKLNKKIIFNKLR